MTTPSVPSIPDLAERLKELEAKATPGEWLASKYSSIVGLPITAPDPLDPLDNLVVVSVRGIGTNHAEARVSAEANAALVAGLRNLLPEIISSLEELSRLKAGEGDRGTAAMREAAAKMAEKAGEPLVAVAIRCIPLTEPLAFERSVSAPLPPAPGGRSDG